MAAFDLTRHTPQPGDCERCNGTGFCPDCAGDGRYRVRGSEIWTPCLRCRGSGECSDCAGTGRVLPEATNDR